MTFKVMPEKFMKPNVTKMDIGRDRAMMIVEGKLRKNA
jgi:hypothetical protein